MTTLEPLMAIAPSPPDQLLLRFRDNAQLRPYVVFTAGRSRTMWLSAFLTYGICVCNFESIAKVGSFQEVMNMLTIPGLGAAETMAAPAWPLLLTAAPNLAVVVVRRPLEEILESLVEATRGRLQLDLGVLRRLLAYIQRSLDKLSLQPQTLTVDFHELSQEATCSEVFEHCLPYKHDSGWLGFMQKKVLDPDVVQLSALYQLRQQQIMGLGRECRHLLFRLKRSGHMKQLVEA